MVQPMDSPTLTVINSANTELYGPHISYELAQAIEECIEKKRKVFLYFNRRGYGRSLVCQDCGYHWNCPYCDIGFTYHREKKSFLLCHHCSNIESIPTLCPTCSGTNIEPVWIGIQKIEYSLSELFPKARIMRIDSDSKKGWEDFHTLIDQTDIILGTQMALTLQDEGIALIGFLLLDTELTIPEYDIEERIYIQAMYAIKHWVNVIIQTYMQNSPLLHDLLSGNYRTFLTRTLEERKRYNYPPYGELVYLWIRDIQKEKVKDILAKLVNKLEIYRKEHPEEPIFLAYDRDIWEKRGGEWIQKIVLKWNDLTLILNYIKTEIVKNRQISIQKR